MISLFFFSLASVLAQEGIPALPGGDWISSLGIAGVLLALLWFVLKQQAEQYSRALGILLEVITEDAKAKNELGSDVEALDKTIERLIGKYDADDRAIGRLIRRLDGMERAIADRAQQHGDK